MALATGTLIDSVWPQQATGASLLRPALLAIAGSVLVAVCAQIAVPLAPVPMTMQTFAVLLIGLAYGARLGAATLALYWIEAAVGLPVLQGFAGGIGQLVGPTGGYVAGFVVAAGVVGWLADRGWSRSVLFSILAMLAGTVIIYAFGATWLSFFVGGAAKAWEFGVAPFLVVDGIKALLAAACLPVAWKLLGR
jgi:biotin transport system substrate-specific component